MWCNALCAGDAVFLFRRPSLCVWALSLASDFSSLASSVACLSPIHTHTHIAHTHTPTHTTHTHLRLVSFCTKWRSGPNALGRTSRVTACRPSSKTSMTLLRRVVVRRMLFAIVAKEVARERSRRKREREREKNGRRTKLALFIVVLLSTLRLSLSPFALSTLMHLSVSAAVTGKRSGRGKPRAREEEEEERASMVCLHQLVQLAPSLHPSFRRYGRRQEKTGFFDRLLRGR